MSEMLSDVCCLMVEMADGPASKWEQAGVRAGLVADSFLQFGGVVGLGDGAASGSKRESQYRGVAEAERRAESMKRITEAAIKERAAGEMWMRGDCASGVREAAGTLRKCVCRLR